MENGDDQPLLLDLGEREALQLLQAASGGLKHGVSATVGDVWGGLVGDRVAEWRRRNLLKIADRTTGYLRDRGVSKSDARALPNGELYFLFEGASKADEPKLQELWARLLACRLDPDAEKQSFDIFSKIIGSLSVIEAALLTFLYEYQVANQNWRDDEQAYIDKHGRPSPGNSEYVLWESTRTAHMAPSRESRKHQAEELVRALALSAEESEIARDALLASRLIEPIVYPFRRNLGQLELMRMRSGDEPERALQRIAEHLQELDKQADDQDARYNRPVYSEGVNGLPTPHYQLTSRSRKLMQELYPIPAKP